jgi:hypothetical protein
LTIHHPPFDANNANPHHDITKTSRLDSLNICQVEQGFFRSSKSHRKL